MKEILQRIISDDALFLSLFTVILSYLFVIIKISLSIKKQKKRYDKEITSENDNLKLSYQKNNKGHQELTSSLNLKQDTLNEMAKKRSDDNFLKKVSLSLTLIMAITAALLIIIGAILSFIYESKSLWLITTSGVCIQFIACLSFWLLHKAIKEVNQNNLALEKVKDQITAIDLVEKIEDKSLKDQTYAEIIKSLVK